MITASERKGPGAQVEDSLPESWYTAWQLKSTVLTVMIRQLLKLT